MSSYYAKIVFSFFLALVFSTSYSASLPPVEGKTFMAVSAQSYASQVGANILKKGGNAIDAAVAMGYALAVVYPCCGNIGGGGFMLIRFANGKSTFINFREKAPKGIKPELFLDNNGNVIPDMLSSGHVGGLLKKPYLAVGVPGTVLGLNTALKQYGTMSLKEVIQPAINLAENGFVLRAGDIEALKTGEQSFKEQPNVAAIFLKNGQSYAVKDILIQKNLANTLKEIAKSGSDAFYHGRIGQELIKANKEQGGLITEEDLNSYTVEEYPPITCTYRGYNFITTPPPSSGGTTICEILNITEGYPLQEYGFRSAKSAHFTLEAMRYAFADRNTYLGDPHYVKNPIDKLLSKEYASQIRQKISDDKVTDSHSIGFIAAPPGGCNTTSYVVLDKAGTAVSVTYTLNDYFGAKVIPGNTGFFLNNEMADFAVKAGAKNMYGLVQGGANIIGPGRRPLSSMAPTIVTKDTKLYLIIGTPGGSTIPTQLLNAFQNIIDYGMNIQEAENAPKFHMQWLPDLVFTEPYAFSPDTQRLLENMGYHFKMGSPYDTKYWGSITAIMVDQKTAKIYGAMDARRPTGAAIGD